MCGEKKRSRVDHQHPEADILGPTVKFVGDIATEHASADDDDVKRVTAVIPDLVPSAARPTAEKFMRERRLLDINESIRIGVEARQHLSLLCCFRIVPVRARTESFGCVFAVTRLSSCLRSRSVFVHAPRHVSGAATTEHNRY